MAWISTITRIINGSAECSSGEQRRGRNQAGLVGVMLIMAGWALIAIDSAVKEAVSQ